jgi:hypothetical protein
MIFDNLALFSKGLSPEDSENYRTRLRELFAKGTRERTLTQSEIEKAIPYSVIESEMLNEIVKTFEDEGIKVLRSNESIAELLSNHLTLERYKWIKHSALTERAYWIGALEALSLTDTDESQRNRVNKKILKTLFYRQADNSFPKTNLGISFFELEQYIGSQKDMSFHIQKITEQIHTQLVALNDQFIECLNRAKKLNHEMNRREWSDISTLENDRKSSQLLRERQHQILESLKECLQYLALLQTRHDMESRFDPC